jgi:UDPglucose 6-dehydrogenase
MKVAVIGLGKLGLPLAAIYGESNHTVYAFDSNLALMESLKSQTLTFNEPGLDALLNKNRKQINYETDFSNLVQESEIISIIVPTPSHSGKFSNEIILDVLSHLADELKKTNKYKLINIVSTVMPGSCEEYFVPLIEEKSKKICGVDFGLCYSPEFIALGSVISNLQRPDMILIGANEKKSAILLEEFSRTIVLEKNPSIMTLSLSEAEIVKIAVNNFVTMKISFANMINQLSSYFPDTNSALILKAIGMDSRVGNAYLNPGTPYGGPCFPRDTVALSNVFKGKIKNDLPNLIANFNIEYSEFLFGRIEDLCKGKKTIGIIGVTYKSDTSVIEESFGTYCIGRFLDLGYEINFWDSQVDFVIDSTSGKKANLHHDLTTLVQQSDVLLITRRLSQMEKNDFFSIEHNLSVIDLWNLK